MAPLFVDRGRNSKLKLSAINTTPMTARKGEEEVEGTRKQQMSPCDMKVFAIKKRPSLMRMSDGSHRSNQSTESKSQLQNLSRSPQNL